MQERQKAEKTQTHPTEPVKEAKPTYKPKGIYNDLAFTNATKTMKKDPRFRIETDVGTILSDTGLGDVLANVKKSINRQTKAETGRELLPRDWDKRKNSIVRSLKRGGLLSHTQSPEKKV